MTRRVTTTITTEIHESVVDGVQTFWVDAGPPFVATLMFRVGIADETLATRGITHLVEHLALSPLRDVAHPFNGAVAIDTTTFWAAGSVEDVAGFIGRLAGNLADLPTDRLEIEAGIVIAEGRAFQTSSHATMLGARFGPQGPGLVSYPEFGLRRVDAAAARQWATDRFTVANAVLLLTGPPPEAMRLPLPTGARFPLVLPPDNYWFLADGPVRIEGQTAGVAVGAFGERSMPLVMAGNVVAMRAEELVRNQLGRVYAVAHDYLRLSADEAFLYWGADCDPEHTAEVTEAVGTVLGDVMTSGPTQAELDRLLALALQVEVMDPADVARDELHRRAAAALLGHPHHSRHEIESKIRAATKEDIAEALATPMKRAMAIAAGTGLGFLEAIALADEPITGRSFRTKIDGANCHYVLGTEAISDVTGRVVTLRFDNLAAVEWRDEDVRLLIDERGSWITLKPKGRRLRRLVTAVDQRVPPDVVVPVSRGG